jgi:hypothetical protein
MALARSVIYGIVSGSAEGLVRYWIVFVALLLFVLLS